MKKKSANLPVIAVAAVAVCLVAVAVTLVMKARVDMPPVMNTELTESVGNNYYFPSTEEETENTFLSSLADLTAGSDGCICAERGCNCKASIHN